MSLWITRSVRRRLSPDEVDAGSSGKITLPSFSAAYALAGLLRQVQAVSDGEASGEGVDASELLALDVLEDLIEKRFDRLLSRRGDLLERGLRSLGGRWGEERAAEVLSRLRDELDLGGVSGTPSVADSPAPTECVRELLVLSVLARHAGARKVLGHLGLAIDEDPELDEAVAALGELLEAEPAPVAPDDDLLADLSDSLEASGNDFASTLAAALERWDDVGDEDRRRIEGALGLLAEAQAPRFAGGHAPDPGIGLAGGPAAYTPDAAWMPGLVLQAKNVLVWLDQLSRRYGRPIRRLDEVPPEEIDLLARRGVTGLWLIGVWERSPASARIKHAQGNAEAAPSAYAVRRYRIAADLGGEEALERLAALAARRGIRLAADVVPNHMAIDSDWVIEHPERFLSVPEPPFPSYRFSGEDLSSDPRVGLYLEDHYADRSDAAVVFERVDRLTGERRYIYHGNDGTSTPWNDTAQLDYLNPETRRAVIDQIVEAARAFPILRFDAAMTLTRQHIHRLWYPAPGSAGAIPSRAEHGLSNTEMERSMPTEFWREVVDRVCEGAPDTLLVAEAFWLLEGYFVRRLGMHRVYNSAFMHLLRDERTETLRRMWSETVALDAAILGRFVNYLSNPDEETAVGQFGSGDRYFGACKVLATLPGLPLLAHGQWEGLAEKYGMEYRRAYSDEREDAEIVARHDREIAPLLARRELFSGVEEFQLLVLVDGGRTVDSVLAYTNGRGLDLVIVAFNNSAEEVSGVLLAEGGDELERRLDEAVTACGAGDEAATEWRLADLSGERRVVATRAGTASGGFELRLAPYECVVLKLAPAADRFAPSGETTPDERVS